MEARERPHPKAPVKLKQALTRFDAASPIRYDYGDKLARRCWKHPGPRRHLIGVR